MPQDELTQQPLDLLRRGEVTVKGRMPWSSNGTFLVEVGAGEVRTLAVYKPVKAERPLWDFPPGLHRRELASYLLSEVLGWGIVPPTIVRHDDLPLGEGSLQAFVPADFAQHYFTLFDADDGRFHPQLRRICAFDILSNQTDRKSGHCLLDDNGRIFAIDNGLSFHAEFKLRTVIWEFATELVPDDVLTDIGGLLRSGLPGPLADLLDPFERDALLARAQALVDERRYPLDHTGSRYPWPMV